MLNQTLLDQLYEIHIKDEWWLDEKLSKEESDRYHGQLIEQGNIITLSYGDVLLGYVEFWKLSFHDFGRIICGEPFSALFENVVNGQIAYVANTYIRPEYRGKEVYKILRKRYFEATESCTHDCGQARRKKSEPVKVFKRAKILE